MDKVSLVLGILGILIWPLRYIGLIVNAAGLAIGIVSQKRRKSNIAVTGIVLTCIGLVISILEWKFGLLDLILKTYFRY